MLFETFRRRTLMLSSVVAGLLSTLPMYNSAGLLSPSVVEARTPRYSYCNVNEYYETWQSNVQNQYGELIVNEQLHYRVNGDCTWKAYQQSYNIVAAGSNGNGPIPQYQQGPDLYQGAPGNPAWFDGGFSSCTNNSTDSFAQTSASAALIQTQTQWWTTSNCSYGAPVTDSHYPVNQP